MSGLPVLPKRHSRPYHPLASTGFISVFLLASCDIYNANLIEEWRDSDSIQTQASPDNTKPDSSVIDPDDEKDRSHLENDFDTIAYKEADDCIVNVDDDGSCPWICQEICDDQDNDCDGYTDESDTHPVCDLPNASSECFEGSCMVDRCEDGFANCDEDDSNGCETELDTDINCSDCEDSCADLSESDQLNVLEAACIDRKCTVTRCEQNYQDCNETFDDGCETEVSDDASNCGGCSVECTALPEVAAAECQKGECVIHSCEVGYSDCNRDASDGCEERLTEIKPPESECASATYGGRQYSFCETAKTWDDARDSCMLACMELVRVDDEDENAFLRSEISGTLWIGANDIEGEGEWVWTPDNDPFWFSDFERDDLWGLLRDSIVRVQEEGPYSNWVLGRPRDSEDTNCARILDDISGRWVDDECSASYGYICQLDLPCYPCNSPGFCETAEGATCDEDNDCVYPPDPNTSCDDGDPCTYRERCQEDKSCIGIPYSCNDPGLCETTLGATCNGDGRCTYPADEGASCDDRNPCTVDDICQRDKSCDGSIDVGAACDDGDGCTINDVCVESGQCIGSPRSSCTDEVQD